MSSRPRRPRSLGTPLGSTPTVALAPRPAAALKKLDQLLPLLASGLAAVFTLRRMDDPDTWWHLAAGRWIFEHRAVPHTDTLSFTVPDHAWTDLQWLFDTGIFGIHQIGGPHLLVILTAAAFACSFWLLIENTRPAVGRTLAALVALWVLVPSQERFAVRPEAVSLLLLQALLWVLDSARRDGGRSLWLLIPLMLLWVNCHALFVIGWVAIICYMASALLADLRWTPQGWKRASRIEAGAKRRLLGFGSAALFATVANPYALQGILFPVQLFSRINGSTSAFQSIGEFRPPFSGYFATPSVGAYQAFLITAAVLVISAVFLTTFAAPRAGRASRGNTAAGQMPPRPDLAGLFLFVALAYLSLLARRNMALFAMGSAPFVGRCFRLVAERLPARARTFSTRLTPLLATALAALIVCTGWFVATNRYYRWARRQHFFGTGVSEAETPIRAAAFIKETGLPSHVYHGMTLGGYFAWRRAFPDGIFIDGRLEVYDDAFFADYVERRSKPRLWQESADRLGINTVVIYHVWPNRWPLIHWLVRSAAWHLVYYDDMVIIFVRQAGNEATIREADERFPAWNERTVRFLRGAGPSWQWPNDRARSLEHYAKLLDRMGRLDLAVDFYRRLVDLGVVAPVEVQARVRLAAYYLSQKEKAQGLAQLRKALDADPENAQVARFLAQYGK